MSTERKLTIGFLAALVVLVANAAVSYWNLLDLNRKGEWVDHTRKVQVAISDLDSTIRDAELSHRSYLLTGSEGWKALATEAMGTIGPQVHGLRAMTADNPRQQELVGRLDAILKDRAATLARTAEARRAGPLADPAAVIGRGTEADRPLGPVLAIEKQMSDEENAQLGPALDRLAQDRPAVDRHVHDRDGAGHGAGRRRLPADPPDHGRAEAVGRGPTRG